MLRTHLRTPAGVASLKIYQYMSIYIDNFLFWKTYKELLPVIEEELFLLYIAYNS